MSDNKCKQESELAIFTMEKIVGEGDLDPIYRHVHHARTLLFMEEARLSFLEKIGFSSPRLISEGLYPVIVAISIRYRREITAGPIKVTCEECRVEHLLLRIKQRILSADDRLLVEAQVDSALMSGQTKRAVPPSADFIKAFS